MLRRNSIKRLAQPEYLLRPIQIARRIWRERVPASEESTLVRLPWKLNIRVDPREAIGFALASQGLYEPLVTEALWRLTLPGDLVVDAGANIGYMASILSVRTGVLGKVYCFEPHPDVFRQLEENVASWKNRGPYGPIQLFAAGLGERDGTGRLHIPDQFPANRGTSSANVSDLQDGTVSLPVQVKCLDRLIEKPQIIALMKIDVEGNELAVLKGMREILKERRVRNIVFEEFADFPAATHDLLKEHGYAVFGLEKRFRGIRCVAGRPYTHPTEGPSPNYLATMDPERTLPRIESGLWKSFGPARLLGRASFMRTSK